MTVGREQESMMTEAEKAALTAFDSFEFWIFRKQESFWAHLIYFFALLFLVGFDSNVQEIMSPVPSLMLGFSYILKYWYYLMKSNSDFSDLFQIQFRSNSDSVQI